MRSELPGSSDVFVPSFRHLSFTDKTPFQIERDTQSDMALANTDVIVPMDHDLRLGWYFQNIGVSDSAVLHSF